MWRKELKIEIETKEQLQVRLHKGLNLFFLVCNSEPPVKNYSSEEKPYGEEDREKTSRKVYLCEDLFDIDSLRTEYVSPYGRGCVGERGWGVDGEALSLESFEQYSYIRMTSLKSFLWSRSG